MMMTMMNLGRIIPSLLVVCLISHTCKSSNSCIKVKRAIFFARPESPSSITRLLSHSDSVSHRSIDKFSINQPCLSVKSCSVRNPIQYMAITSSSLLKNVHKYAFNLKRILLSTTLRETDRVSRRNNFGSIASSSLSRICLFLLLCTFLNPRKALASVIMPSESSNSAAAAASPLQNLLAWFLLFTLSAVMHSAESAITKISPWKVQQFVDEEGSSSPFSTLSKDITRLLITILLTTTACSIYSTALFVATISQLFPNCSLGFITAALVLSYLHDCHFPRSLLMTALYLSCSTTDCRDSVLRRAAAESAGRVQLGVRGPEAGPGDQPAVHAAAARHRHRHLPQRPRAQECRHAQRRGQKCLGRHAKNGRRRG